MEFEKLEFKQNYEDRLTIFIDILGFKSLLNQSEKKQNNQFVDNVEVIKKIQEIYSEIFFYVNIDELNYFTEDKQVSIFSDCIVISVKTDGNKDVIFLFLAIKSLILSLLKKDVVCRGAITYGKLIHTKDYIFGPALVEAYILESKSANYPRIIIDESVFSMLHEGKAYTTFVKEVYFKKDLDGMYYLDYFNLLSTNEDDNSIELNIFDDAEEGLMFLSNLKNFISDSLKKHNRYDHADTRVKYVWMREKINECINVLNTSGIDKKKLREYKLTTGISSRRDF